MTGAIALIAHDAKKPDMVAFAQFHRSSLATRRLMATESTGALLERTVGLHIERMLPGVEGGDVQIAARVVQGDVKAVIFMVDPFDRHAHEPDIQSVQRVCQVHDIPLATNVATAHMILAALDYYGEEAAS
jgi:methylglyoxal synthase